MGASSCLGVEGTGVGVGLPDTSPGDLMPSESPKVETLSWLQSRELQSLPQNCRALGLEGNNPSCQRTAGGGFRPEGKLSQEPGEPQNPSLKLRIFGPKEKLSDRSQETRNCPFKIQEGDGSEDNTNH